MDDIVVNAWQALAKKEESIVRRMLCAWDPSWGPPELIYRQSLTRGALLRENLMAARPFAISSSLVGLGRGCLGEMAKIMVYARDQVDEAGNLLPPIPDRGQLAIYEALLASMPIANVDA